MKKGEKLKNFLKHPGVWLWAFYAALAFFGAACIIVAVLWNGENPVAYSLYAVTAILLGYCIYASVAPAKALVSRLVHSNKVTERMISDYGYRTTAFLAISLIVNGAYAIFMAVLGCNVSFADALVSVFALQMAMIATFTEGGDIGEMGTFNIITGAAVFLLTLGMGIYMTVRAAYGLKKLKSVADGGAAGGNERCAAREEARDGNQNTDNAAQTGGEGV